MKVDKAELRRRLAEEQGPICAMPDCHQPWTDMAHIRGSGMGGTPSSYVIDNLVGLCHRDHMVFDGHLLQGRQSMLRVLMRTVVKQQREGHDG